VVILGEDEQAQGKVKIKEMGLPEGHLEKDGVLIDLDRLVPEVRKRLAAKDERDGLAGTAAEVEGLSLQDDTTTR